MRRSVVIRSTGPQIEIAAGLGIPFDTAAPTHPSDGDNVPRSYVTPSETARSSSSRSARRPPTIPVSR